MEPKNLLAIISRDYLHIKKVAKYRMKKVANMTDDEVISICHFYCEENNLIAEWNQFREKSESEYCYCSYLEKYIAEGLCYDLQMITGNYIKPSALPEINIDKDKCAKCCAECKYSL
jgi:hypothetical protein